MTVQNIMNEVREGRVRMSRECGHDPSKLIAYLQEYNRKYSAQVSQYRKDHPARENVTHAEH